MFDLGAFEPAESPLYDWDLKSTYIRRPPYWEGALAGERTMKGMRPLAVLGDNITTDHLSPSNAIQLNSASGAYLDKMGVPHEDFNSYATKSNMAIMKQHNVQHSLTRNCLMKCVVTRMAKLSKVHLHVSSLKGQSLVCGKLSKPTWIENNH